MKAGIKTSELWVTLSAMGGILWTFAQQHCSVSPTEFIALVIALAGAAGAYTVGRSIVKAKQQ